MLKGWFPANHLFPQLYSYVRMTWAWQTGTPRAWVIVSDWTLVGATDCRHVAAGEQTYWLINPRFDSDPLQALKPFVWAQTYMTWRWNMSSVCQLTVPFTPRRVFHILHFSWHPPKRLTVGIRFTSYILDKISTVNSRLQVSDPLCSNKSGDLKGQNDSTHTIALFPSMFLYQVISRLTVDLCVYCQDQKKEKTQTFFLQQGFTHKLKTFQYVSLQLKAVQPQFLSHFTAALMNNRCKQLFCCVLLRNTLIYLKTEIT